MKLKLNQSGFALLMLLVVLFGLAAVALSTVLTSSVKQQHAQNSAENRRVLLEAKEALLSYALEYKKSGNLNEMGKLPCPDVTDTTFPGDFEGVQDNPCGATAVNTIGYFPFKTLGMGKMEDSASECLWYVVSGDYKNQAGSSLLNWDTVGYLNLRDENNTLKHGGSEDDFPVAFIISPGANLDQDRTPDGDLPLCGAKYNSLASYLEDGPFIDYATQLPATADTLWNILTASGSSQLQNANYNDQVIAINRNELWDRIRMLDDLSFDNAPGVAATSPIEQLTQSLAECIADYGNDNILNPNRYLPYPAPIDLVPADDQQEEYRDEDFYDNVDTIRYGRFPQIVDDSVIPHNNFVLDASAAQSYCEAAGVLAYDELFWSNWKDHFFYILSHDFDESVAVPVGATKCAVNGCIQISGNVIDKVAAMVIFAGSAEPGVSRTWWWNEATSSATDAKLNVSSYLEGDNQTGYAGGPRKNFNLEPNDYAWCIEYDNVLFTLSAVKCADL